MRIFFIFILLFSYLFSLTIAASSNLSFVLPEIIKNFKKDYPNINVKVVYSSSGILYSQILHKAPFDVFLSADQFYPMKLYKLHISSYPKIYAKGKLVLVSKYPINSVKEALLNSNKIAIANYKIAPYGKSAKEFLVNMKLFNRLKNKLIYANSISLAFNYALKSESIAIVAKSLVYNNNFLYYKDLNSRLYSLINQAVVILHQNNDSRLFYNYLFSDKIQNIFEKYGYNKGE